MCDLIRDIERSGSRIGRNAHIALHAEYVIARRHFAVIRIQTMLMAFASVMAAIGLVMAIAVAFYWLAETAGMQVPEPFSWLPTRGSQLYLNTLHPV